MMEADRLSGWMSSLIPDMDTVGNFSLGCLSLESGNL